jgi:5'-methylthioadenosine phosphorylase
MKLGVILGTGFHLDLVPEYEAGGTGRARLADGQVEVFAIHRQTPSVPPHRVDYIRNMKAMLDFGADVLLTTTACGSLTAEVAPGSFVVPDDMVDLAGYTGSFIGDRIHHPAANPVYDAGIREALRAGFGIDGDCFGGTIVSIRGPRFATKAESLFYQRQGWSYINMTTAQETTLALECDVPIAVLGHVTDYDSGVPVVGDPSDLELIRARMEQGNTSFNEKFAEFAHRLVEP